MLEPVIRRDDFWADAVNSLLLRPVYRKPFPMDSPAEALQVSAGAGEADADGSSSESSTTEPGKGSVDEWEASVAAYFSQPPEVTKAFLKKFPGVRAAIAQAEEPSETLEFQIPPDRIGDVVGPKGKVIGQIGEQHQVRVEINGEGTVVLKGDEVVNLEAAQAAILAIVEGRPRVGTRFLGTVEGYGDLGTRVYLGVEKLGDGWLPPDASATKLNVGDRVAVEVAHVKEDGTLMLEIQKSTLPIQEREAFRNRRFGGISGL